MGYQPFLIGNFRSGLNMAVEPWLLPRDAFQSLINARLYRGVVEKVDGYLPYTKTYEGVISRLFPAADGTVTTFTATLSRTPRTLNFTGYSVITAGLSSELFTYASDDGIDTVILQGSAGGSGTLNLSTGALSLLANTAPPAGTTVFFQFYAGPRAGFTRYPIVGIKPYYTALGETQTLIFDTQKLCIINSQRTSTDAATIFSFTEQLNQAATEVPHDYYASSVIVGDAVTVAFSGTLANPISPGTVNFYQFLSTGAPLPASTYDYNTPDISDNGVGALTGVGISSGTGSINYYTGAWSFTFSVAPAAGNYFDATVGVFGQIFNGGNNNFFSLDNYQNKAFFCNNFDPVFYYDGDSVKYLRTNLTTTPITSSGGIPNNTSPYITSCLHVFVNRERLLLLSPTIIVQVAGKTRQSTGVYWSQTSNPLVWTNNSALFAPTSQPIITAGFVNSDLIVRFTNSEYVFRYTSDAFAPFRFDPTNNNWNCAAPYGTISYDSWISTLGLSAIIGSDGWNIRRVDESIPDFTDSYRIAGQYPIPYLAEDSIANSYGTRFDQTKEGWLCYSSEFSPTFSDNVLAFNYLDGNYSIYTFSLTCLGSSSAASFTQTWGTDYDRWGEVLDTWGSYQLQKNTQLDLGGDANGFVYTLNSGTTIGSTKSRFFIDIITKDFNPFVDQGQLCRLGYVDFLVSNSSIRSSFTIEIFCNNNLEAFIDTDHQASFTQKIGISPNDTMSPYLTQEKSWIRVYVGLVAKSHTIRIFQDPNDVGNPFPVFDMHSMVLYMQPAGRLFN
jgi:hypothetical protein